MEHILSWIIWLPVIGIAVILFIPREKETLIKLTSAGATGIQFLLAMLLWSNFDSGVGTFQFVERGEWIPSINIFYSLGVDGLSLPMVILTPLLCFLAVFVSWNIDRAVKGYFALFLLLNTGMIGVFLALDFFLFYVFWEVMCFIGAFPVFKAIVIISTLGILLNAAYFLSAYKRIFFGELNEKYKDISDINTRELLTVVPLAVVTLFLGVYPRPFLDLISSTIDHLIYQVTQIGGFAGF